MPRTRRSRIYGRTRGGVTRYYGDFRDLADVGGVAVLQSMPTEGIAYIRHYDGIEASSRWGLGHESGVIFVRNRQGLGPGGPP